MPPARSGNVPPRPVAPVRDHEICRADERLLTIAEPNRGSVPPHGHSGPTSPSAIGSASGVRARGSAMRGIVLSAGAIRGFPDPGVLCRLLATLPFAGFLVFPSPGAFAARPGSLGGAAWPVSVRDQLQMQPGEGGGRDRVAVQLVFQPGRGVTEQTARVACGRVLDRGVAGRLAVGAEDDAERGVDRGAEERTLSVAGLAMIEPVNR